MSGVYPINSSNVYSPYQATNNSPLYKDEIKGEVMVSSDCAEWVAKDGSTYDVSRSYPEFFQEIDSENSHVLCISIMYVYVKEPGCCWPLPINDTIPGRFPTHLPIRYFLGKRRHDSIELISKDKTRFLLRCILDDTTVEKSFMKAYNLMIQQQQTGTKLWKSIDKIKQEYFPCSKIASVGPNCTIL